MARTACAARTQSRRARQRPRLAHNDRRAAARRQRRRRYRRDDSHRRRVRSRRGGSTRRCANNCTRCSRGAKVRSRSSACHIDIRMAQRLEMGSRRAAPERRSLAARVLDVGCGNGYYGWRMCAAGARCVIGIDPTLVYLMQYLAALRYLMPARPAFVNAVLPARLEDAPAAMRVRYGVFDGRPLPPPRSARAPARVARATAPGRRTGARNVDRRNGSIVGADTGGSLRAHAQRLADSGSRTLLRWVESAAFVSRASSTSPRRRRPNSAPRRGCRSSRSRRRSTRPIHHARSKVIPRRCARSSSRSASDRLSSTLTRGAVCAPRRRRGSVARHARR